MKLFVTVTKSPNPALRSIHPQGWVPIETCSAVPTLLLLCRNVAFTPKGGCPLKHSTQLDEPAITVYACSIHPQGWVPIETGVYGVVGGVFVGAICSIHPQGWVPIETRIFRALLLPHRLCSIHPQGWVPIETESSNNLTQRHDVVPRSIHPQGWVPIETRQLSNRQRIADNPGSIHPQGWVPIETRGLCLLPRERDGMV